MTTSIARPAIAGVLLDRALVQPRTAGVRPVRPLRTPSAAPLCPIELRALRAGARTLADTLTGIALDAPCDRERQRAVRDGARLLLGGMRSAAERIGDADVDAAARRVHAALPTFVHDVSAGAPALALACAGLADLLDERAPGLPVHDHGRGTSPLACERRTRVGGGLPARSAVPWFLGAASPAERAAAVRDASPRVRWALRSGEERHRRTVQLLRG